MQGFHRSRVRILFEVLCALGMSASLAGAWQQTFAPALLAAAAIAGLYGIVHAFDMIRPKAAAEAEPVAAPSEPAEEPSDTVIRTWPLTTRSVEEPQPVAPPPAKAPRKKRRTSKAAQPVEEQQLAPVLPEPVEEQQLAPVLPEPEPEPEAAEPAPEPEHAPIAPLFEPEPFLRTPRAAFGRKAG